MDVASERYVASVDAELRAALGPLLVGVYLHGSAVLGGFDERRSDVDILVVSNGPISSDHQTELAAALSEEALPCPAAGLELSVVTRDVARRPSAEPPFEAHLATAPHDSAFVDGRGAAGDTDLVLHFAVCRAAGRRIGPGPSPQEVFAPVDRQLVLAQLAAEMDWGLAHAPNEYAVLNACRGWKFRTDGSFVSKLDGGEWALSQIIRDDHVDLVTGALARQRCLASPTLETTTIEEFVKTIAARLRPDDPVRHV